MIIFYKIIWQFWSNYEEKKSNLVYKGFALHWNIKGSKFVCVFVVEFLTFNIILHFKAVLNLRGDWICHQ